jgi:hypothetical protein
MHAISPEPGIADCSGPFWLWRLVVCRDNGFGPERTEKPLRLWSQSLQERQDPGFVFVDGTNQTFVFVVQPAALLVEAIAKPPIDEFVLALSLGPRASSRRVEPSMSLKKKVTVPVGADLATALGSFCNFQQRVNEAH